MQMQSAFLARGALDKRTDHKRRLTEMYQLGRVAYEAKDLLVQRATVKVELAVEQQKVTLL